MFNIQTVWLYDYKYFCSQILNGSVCSTKEWLYVDGE